MKALRPKPAEYGKAFKFFDKKEDFNRLDGSENQMIISRAEIEKKPEAKKEEITRQKIEIITTNRKSKNKNGLPLNYIRLVSEMNLPRADTYELSEVDHTFLLNYQNKYVYGGKKVLTTQLLEKCFVQLETIVGKDFSNLPKTLKSRLKTFLEEKLCEQSKMDKFDEFVDLIYNRWRGRREQLKYPLLRQLWRPNMDDTSHYLAFRPRQKKGDKRHLRRPNKYTQDDVRFHVETLSKQIQKSKQITDRVIARQKYKLAMFNLDLQKFNLEIKGYKQEPLFVKQFDKKQILKFKDDHLKLSVDFEAQKQAEKIQNIVQEVSTIAQDSKTSICNFIANLSSLANQVGIDWQTLNSVNTRPGPAPIYPSPPISDPTKGTTGLSMIVVPLISTNILKFNVSKIMQNPSYIQRNYSPVYSQGKSQRSYQTTNSTFSMKQKQVCKYYYYDQDDDDGKDMKKYIQASFKKFNANKAS